MPHRKEFSLRSFDVTPRSAKSFLNCQSPLRDTGSSLSAAIGWSIPRPEERGLSRILVKEATKVEHWVKDHEHDGNVISMNFSPSRLTSEGFFQGDRDDHQVVVSFDKKEKKANLYETIKMVLKESE